MSVGESGAGYRPTLRNGTWELSKATERINGGYKKKQTQVSTLEKLPHRCIIMSGAFDTHSPLQHIIGENRRLLLVFGCVACSFVRLVTTRLRGCGSLDQWITSHIKIHEKNGSHRKAHIIYFSHVVVVKWSRIGR